MSLLGSITGADDAAAAGRMQAEATRQSMEMMKQQYEQGRKDMNPWLQAGQSGLKDYLALMGLGGNTTGAMNALQHSPTYAFGMNQGNRSLAALGGAHGGRQSGKAMTAALKFGQDYAGQQYHSRLADLAGLSGQGLGAAGSMAGYGNQYAGNMGNALTAGANAQGASQIAAGNATRSTLFGLGSLGIQAYGAGMFD
jgi:hypothetical protein